MWHYYLFFFVPYTYSANKTMLESQIDLEWPKHINKKRKHLFWYTNMSPYHWVCIGGGCVAAHASLKADIATRSSPPLTLLSYFPHVPIFSWMNPRTWTQLPDMKASMYSLNNSFLGSIIYLLFSALHWETWETWETLPPYLIDNLCQITQSL